MRTTIACGLALVVALSCVSPAYRTPPLATITAAATPMSEPSAAITPTPAPSPSFALDTPSRNLREIAGIEFALGGAPVDLRIESSITRADEAALGAAVAADVDAVERDLDRSFTGRTVIYVFATTATYTLGLERIFGYSPATAAFVAENSISFFEPSLLLIAVNWEAIRERRPIAAIRHELTHRLTLDVCAPRCDLVPAWLNEGQARLAEASFLGSELRLLRVRYEAASMAATGTLIPLNALVTQFAWNSLTDWAGYYKYQEAARVTELLREDVGGSAPIARVYDRIRRGQNVAQAYAALTGRSFDEFVAGLPARMLEITPAGPGVVAVPLAPEGPGASYLLFGFAPSETVLLTIGGPWSTETWPVTVSPFGALFDGLAPSRARGTYTISVQHAGGVVTATVTKPTGGRREGSF